MKFQVGGRAVELSKDQVIEKMANEKPELVREFFVELPSGWFPPKQILEEVTKWPRSTFTSHEATRVLSRLGLVCRRVDELSSTSRGESRESLSADSLEAEIKEIRSSIKVLESAVAGLSFRLDALGKDDS